MVPMCSILEILLSGLLATLFSVTITTLTNHLSQKKAEITSLRAVLMQLNAFLVNEPFLENDTSLEKYTAMTNDEKEKKIKKDKYNLYCMMKFNYLESLCRYYGYNRKRIEKELNINEYIKDNKMWWDKNRDANYSGYDDRFLPFIEKVLNVKP